MNDPDFQAFVETFARRSIAPAPAATAFDRVTVLGGGLEARLLACLCLAEGAEVTLFSVSGAERNTLRDAGGVSLRGAGPAGTYAVDRGHGPAIRLGAELDASVQDAELIWLAGAVPKQRGYAMVLAEHLSDGQVVALLPGRSLGALDVARHLRIGGCRAEVTVVEIQAPPYWIRAQGAVLHLSRAAPAPAATLPSGGEDVLQGLSRFLPNLVPVPSVVHSGFADGSGLVEVPALLLGGPAAPPGGPELPAGAEPLPERNTFRALIGERHRAVAAAMAGERRHIASLWGVRELPDLDAWLDLHAGAPIGDMARPVPTAGDAQGLVRCGLTGSLAPLLSAAEVAGVAVPATRAMTTLADAALGGGMAGAGRRLDTIGVGATDIDEARRTMDAIARGEW